MERFNIVFNSSGQLWNIYISSSVTIVSIVGGFIISLMLNISSQRKGLKSKIKTVQNDLEFKTKKITGIKNELGEKIIFNWSYEIISTIFKNKGFYSDLIEQENNLDILYKKNETHTLTKKDLKDHYDEMYNLIEEIIILFAKDIDKYSDHEDFFEGFNKYVNIIDRNISKDRYEIWKKVYDYFIYLNKKERYETMKEDPTSFFPGPMINQHPSVFDSGYQTSVLNDLEKQLKSLNSEISFLQNKDNNLKNELNQLSKPKGLSEGIVLLSYYMLAVICYPVSLKFFNLFNDFHGFMLYILFIFGLILFLVYIVWLLFNISSKEN